MTVHFMYLIFSSLSISPLGPLARVNFFFSGYLGHICDYVSQSYFDFNFMS